MVQFYPIPFRENINFKVLSFEIGKPSNYNNCNKVSSCLKRK